MSAATLHVAAVLSACLLALVVGFQLALATGVRWGAAAYGGRAAAIDGSLPTRYRVSSAVAAFVLTGAGWLILASGDVIDPGPLPDDALGPALWALAALFALNTLGNLAGKHPVERFGASALTTALTVLCLVIAIGR